MPFPIDLGETPDCRLNPTYLDVHIYVALMLKLGTRFELFESGGQVPLDWRSVEAMSPGEYEIRLKGKSAWGTV